MKDILTKMKNANSDGELIELSEKFKSLQQECENSVSLIITSRVKDKVGTKRKFSDVYQPEL